MRNIDQFLQFNKREKQSGTGRNFTHIEMGRKSKGISYFDMAGAKRENIKQARKSAII